MSDLDAITTEIKAFLASCEEGTGIFREMGIDVMAAPEEIMKEWRNVRDVALWNWGCECALDKVIDIINEHRGESILKEL
jgi:hypothetical protein